MTTWLPTSAQYECTLTDQLCKSSSRHSKLASFVDSEKVIRRHAGWAVTQGDVITNNMGLFPFTNSETACQSLLIIVHLYSQMFFTRKYHTFADDLSVH